MMTVNRWENIDRKKEKVLRKQSGLNSVFLEFNPFFLIKTLCPAITGQASRSTYWLFNLA